ncbi:uncharacterized protein LOC127875336 [Dreissena polymorpha]|uniref:uncharacterized protein LOC127875336 n=1 Tax=Dreissena polymorpha TaxID=45954 RepID=UPI0022647EDF|nr:uncharacterized protein LOC127875336 [Dreissena polymorpha]
MCDNDVCECKPGYVQRGDQCIWVYDAHCNTSSDCGQGDLICEPADAPVGHTSKCRCPYGYAFDSKTTFTCIKVLGSYCSDIYNCGNSSHVSYYYDNFEKYPYLVNLPYYCNVDNICHCSPGFKMNDENECQAIYGTLCASDEDCWDNTVSNKFAYKCNSDNNTCSCNDNYYQDGIRDQWHEYNYYYYDWSDDNIGNAQICKPLIGMRCSYGTVNDTQCVNDTGHVYNYPYNFYEYDWMHNQVIECIEGVENYGVCTRILGHDCSTRDDVCRLVANAKCDTYNKCSCNTGFLEDPDKDFCKKVTML